MKNLKILFVVTVLCISITSLAKPITEDPQKQLSFEVADLLQTPRLELDNDEKALVTFILNEANEIVVLSVASENESVSEFIKGRLNYQKIESRPKKSLKNFKVPVTILKS